MEKPEPAGVEQPPARVAGVFACVLTYNRKDIVELCIRALLAQIRQPDRIVIYDNGSTDGTEAHLAAQNLLSRPELVYLRAEHNRGPAAGFHALFDYAYNAGCEWIWVMDDDVIPDPDSLAELLNAFHDNFVRQEEIGFLASRLQTPDGKPNNVPDVDDFQDAVNPPRWAQLLDRGMVRIKFTTFCADLVPRSTIAAFGLPKAAFFYGGEDVEYTMRVARQHPCYMVGKSRATHLRAVSGTFHPLQERDPRRIRLYFYYYRNQLYIRRALMSRAAVLRFLVRGASDALRVLLRGHHRFSMTLAIVRGLSAGVFFDPGGREVRVTSPPDCESKRRR